MGEDPLINNDAKVPIIFGKSLQIDTNDETILVIQHLMKLE